MPALAQPYPTRPIRLIVAVAAGGGSDVVSRLIAPRLSEVLGQQVVVDNRGGASGLIGSELAVRAAPDGYTLLIVTQTHLISTTLHDRFHLAKEYTSIGMVGGTPFVLLASNALNIKNVNELIALAKAKPGFVMFGTSGSGTSSHLCLELLQSLGGIKLMHVSYKGSMAAITDMMGGQIHLTCPAIPSLSLVAGKVRVLGVTTRAPSALAPGIPTIADGLPGYELNGWYGMLAPPGLSPALVTRLNRAFTQVLSEPAIREKLFGIGVEATPSSPEAFSTFLRNETARWSKLLKEAGIKPAV